MTLELFRRFRTILIDVFSTCQSIHSSYIKLFDVTPLVLLIERKFGYINPSPFCPKVLNFNSFRQVISQLAIDNARHLLRQIENLWTEFIDTDLENLNRLAYPTRNLMYTDQVLILIQETVTHLLTFS